MVSIRALDAVFDRHGWVQSAPPRQNEATDTVVWQIDANNFRRSVNISMKKASLKHPETDAYTYSFSKSVGVNAHFVEWVVAFYNDYNHAVSKVALIPAWDVYNDLSTKTYRWNESTESNTVNVRIYDLLNLASCRKFIEAVTQPPDRRPLNQPRGASAKSTPAGTPGATILNTNFQDDDDDDDDWEEGQGDRSDDAGEEDDEEQYSDVAKKLEFSKNEKVGGGRSWDHQQSRSRDDEEEGSGDDAANQTSKLRSLGVRNINRRHAPAESDSYTQVEQVDKQLTQLMSQSTDESIDASTHDVSMPTAATASAATEDDVGTDSIASRMKQNHADDDIAYTAALNAPSLFAHLVASDDEEAEMEFPP